MAFWKVKTDSESIADKEQGQSNYIMNSGMYDITVRHAICRVNDKGAQSIDLIVLYNGVEQTIYRAFQLTNNDGSANGGQQLFNRFCIVCGANGEGFEVPDPVNRMVTTNIKQGKSELVPVLAAFDDKKLTVRMQKQYRRYNGQIKPGMNLRQVFRYVDKATAQEIINKAEAGKQYEIESETAMNDDYRDGITKEEAAAYEEERRNTAKNKEGESSQPAPKRTFASVGSEDVQTDEVPF